MTRRNHLQKHTSLWLLFAVALGLALCTQIASAQAQDQPQPDTLRQDQEMLGATFGSTLRERRLIDARVAARTGQYPKAKKLYETLLKDYSKDEEVIEQYVDTLITNWDLEEAKTILKEWLDRAPNNIPALRLMALMYVRAEELELSFPYFERLLTLAPGDAGTMADYGYALLGKDRWDEALVMFSGVVDADPQNEEATLIVQDILKRKSPHLSVDYTFEELSDKTQVSTVDNRYRAQVDGDTAFEIQYTVTMLDRPERTDINPLQQTIQERRIRLIQDFAQDYTLTLGVGSFDGAGSKLSQEASLAWRAHEEGTFLVELERNRPWLSEVDATRFQGAYNRGALSYQGFYDDRWGLSVQGDFWDYHLLDESYATRQAVSATLTRRLSWRPDLFLNYSYFLGSSEYDGYSPLILDDGTLVRPVDMDAEEQSHTVFLNMNHKLLQNLSYQLTGGASINEVTDRTGYFAGVELFLDVGQRLQIKTGANYNSEDLESGGETKRFSAGIQYIF